MSCLPLLTRRVTPLLPGTPEAATRKDSGDVSVGLWWAGTSALSITVNRMIMRLFDGVGCAPRRAFSLFGHRRRLLFSNYSTRVVYTPTASCYSLHVHQCMWAHTDARPKPRTIMQAPAVHRASITRCRKCGRGWSTDAVYG